MQGPNPWWADHPPTCKCSRWSQEAGNVAGHKCRSSAKPWGQLQMMAHRTPLCQQLQACWVQKSPPRCCPSVSSTRYKTSCFTATVKSTGKNPRACLQESHPAVLLLPQVTAVSLICENFCSAALITARPNYRGRELPSQPQMAWPSKHEFKVTL